MKDRTEAAVFFAYGGKLHNQGMKGGFCYKLRLIVLEKLTFA